MLTDDMKAEIRNEVSNVINTMVEIETQNNDSFWLTYRSDVWCAICVGMIAYMLMRVH